MSTLPQTGATELVESQAAAETAVNEMGRHLDANASRSIIEDRDLTAPPGTCTDGNRYLVKAPATGAWAGKDGKMAIAVGTNASNGWLFQTVATEGFRLYIRDENAEIEYNGSSWVLSTSTLAVAAEWAPNWTSDGDIYIPAVVAMTVDQGNAALGGATITFEKSTSASPSVFSSTTLPASLQAGAWLKVSAAGVSGFAATHLKRTA
jgi:hypothetical protein